MIDGASLLDQILGEKSRVNAALEEPDLNDTVEDVQLAAADTLGWTETVTIVTQTNPPYSWGEGVKWGFAKWGEGVTLPPPAPGEFPTELPTELG